MLEALTVESGFSYLAKDIDLATAAKVEKLGIEGIGQLPGQPPHLPAGGNGGPGDRRGRRPKGPA